LLAPQGTHASLGRLRQGYFLYQKWLQGLCSKRKQLLKQELFSTLAARL
jgi:hypothetical protein